MYLQKLGTLYQTLHLERFATKSTVLSTKIVDGRAYWPHVRRSKHRGWTHITRPSTPSPPCLGISYSTELSILLSRTLPGCPPPKKIGKLGGGALNCLVLPRVLITLFASVYTIDRMDGRTPDRYIDAYRIAYYHSVIYAVLLVLLYAAIATNTLLVFWCRAYEARF